MQFSELGLMPEIVRALTEHGYAQPTPIQQQAIPAVLAGGDLMAAAQTGTGKTAGFSLPLLQRLAQSPAAARGKRIRALVLTPTRELAAQVEESVRTYGKYLALKSLVIFGGVGMQPQIDALKRGVDILVATPGRLLDLHQQNHLDLSQVEILVLDEADRMLDMGFIRDIRKILALLPAKRQNLLFSATFADEIKALADGLLNNPAMVEVARRNSTVDTVAQTIHLVDQARKRELLSHLIASKDWRQVLVFTRTKHGANRLSEQLTKDGITAMAIHGNKSQSARTRALSEFKDGSLRALVATDIAARGIDIDLLPHVVNFDLPNVPEDYVHRIGRTGRAGATGDAVSLVCAADVPLLRDIERLIKRELPRIAVDGFVPGPDVFAADRPAAGLKRPAARPQGTQGQGAQRVAPGADGKPKPRRRRRRGGSGTGGANAGATRQG